MLVRNLLPLKFSTPNHAIIILINCPTFLRKPTVEKKKQDVPFQVFLVSTPETLEQFFHLQNEDTITSVMKAAVTGAEAAEAAKSTQTCGYGNQLQFYTTNPADSRQVPVH